MDLIFFSFLVAMRLNASDVKCHAKIIKPKIIRKKAIPK